MSFDTAVSLGVLLIIGLQLYFVQLRQNVGKMRSDQLRKVLIIQNALASGVLGLETVLNYVRPDADDHGLRAKALSARSFRH